MQITLISTIIVGIYILQEIHWTREVFESNPLKLTSGVVQKFKRFTMQLISKSFKAKTAVKSIFLNLQ